MKFKLITSSLFAATVTATAHTSYSTPAGSSEYGCETEHHLRTMTNGNGQTLLVDDAVSDYGVLMMGESGVDGIYGVRQQETYATTETWVDVDEGYKAVIDYQYPNHYTVYDSADSPILTVSYPTSSAPESSDIPSHYLHTFTNKDGYTLLVDEAVTDAAALILGDEDIDGIYVQPTNGPKTYTGTDTWVDEINGIKAVIDYEHPNHYTLYDMSNNPIQTISY